MTAGFPFFGECGTIPVDLPDVQEDKRGVCKESN